MPPAKVFAPLHSMPPAQGEPHKYYSTVRRCLASGLWTKQKGLDNRKGKILEAFLTDQLRVDSGTERRSSEHQKLCDRGNELQDKLAEKSNDEEKEMLTELVETLFEESCYEEQRKFDRGFRLGFLMSTEIFTEQDIFL